MPKTDKDLIRVTKSLDYLRYTLEKGIPDEAETLRDIISETTFMLNVMQLWAGKSNDDPNCTTPPLINWLEDYEIDLSSKPPASRPFWLVSEEAYLQSQLNPGQKFQQITFTETTPGSGIYTAVAYLCPPAKKIIRGGPNGSFDPAQPPHRP